MVKGGLKRPKVSLKEITIEVLSNIIYLLGIIIIERFLRPMFGEQGIPLLPNIVLMVIELVFFMKLFWILFILTDGFCKDISTSWMYTSAKSRIFSKKSDQGEELIETPNGGDTLVEYRDE